MLSKFVLTLFIARFMGFEVLGLYGLILSATFLIPSFTGLGIMYMKNRSAVTQSPSEIVAMLYCYRRLIAFIYFFLIMIAGISGLYLDKIWLCLVIVFVVLFEHINNDFYTLLLNRLKPLAANILHFIRTSIWIFLFMVIAYFYPDYREIEILLLFWMFGSALALLGFFIVNRHWPWRQERQACCLRSWIKEEFKKSKTIYLNNMVDSSGQYANHFLVTFFLGLELTGVYVFFMQIISAMSNLLRTGVIQTARPKLVSAHKNKESSFTALYNKCINQTLFFSVFMALISFPAMYYITAYIVDKPLALEWFPIFVVNLVLFCVLMLREADQSVLYSYHRDDLILKLSLLNITGLVLISILLIPLFSLWGVATSLLLMEIIVFLTQRKFIKGLVS